jgi:hypothetical protein
VTVTDALGSARGADAFAGADVKVIVSVRRTITSPSPWFGLAPTVVIALCRLEHVAETLSAWAGPPRTPSTA